MTTKKKKGKRELIPYSRPDVKGGFDPNLGRVAVSLYCFLDTPKSLACEIALRYGEFGELANLAASPSHYLDTPDGAERYRKDAQACDLLRKSPLLKIKGLDLKARAVESFDQCEEQCYRTNQMLRDMYRSPGVGEEPFHERLRHVLCKAENILSRVLGKIPAELNGRFGPGTSLELQEQTFSTVADKLWIKPTTTPHAQDIFEHDFWSTLWGRTRLAKGLPLPGTSRGNRFSTVPKDATKLRGICIEPLGNLWGQLGIGGYLKRRLAQVGLRIERSSTGDNPLKPLAKRRQTGQEFHQEMARKASLDGSFATIDLSNASDTICYWLVKWVLPDPWFQLLVSLRSPLTLVTRFEADSDGKLRKVKRWVRLEKFSSMGNGATFELETGIFAAILAAGLGLQLGTNIWVYGDDIILPSKLGNEAMAILKSVGFTPNMKKSFISGPFRESCGGDYFLGVDVRSVFADGNFSSPLEWVALHNSLRKKWPGASRAISACVDAIPTRLRCWGPERLGDTVLHSETYRTWAKDGCRWIATIEAVPVRVPLDRWGYEFIVPLMLLGASSQGITPRGCIEGYRISKASVS